MKNMKKSQLFTLMPALALMSLAGLTACSSSNDAVEGKPDSEKEVVDNQGNVGVRPEFVISFPRSVVSGTRMQDGVTQAAGTPVQFRGMDNIRLIPFNSVPTGSSSKLSAIMTLTSIQALKKEGVLNYKVYADQYVPVGTKNFLFYGKAIDNTAETTITTMEDKFKYGVLKVTGLTDDQFANPNSINFKLEQINSSTEEQAGNSIGRNVIQLMTGLANTTSTAAAPHNAWSTSTNVVLSRLYKNYIGATVSSSASVAAMLSKIYEGLDRIAATDPARPLANAIKTKIEGACTAAPVVGSPASLKSDYAGYPANIGLPDGAARVRWDAANATFVDMAANYNQGLKVKSTDYVYPAALWYYVSTPLKASNVVQSTNYDAETSWANVINNVYSGADDEVVSSTLSVALTEPVQYAVGRIETKMTMGTGTFYDGNGNEVAIGSGFELKGLLIGGQNSVGYDFSSKGSESQTIYDRNMATTIMVKPGETSAANQTLALQTKKDQVIFAALELVNHGEQFAGFDGVIPAGGTFYLTTKLDPKTATNYSETLNKIVMKDHVTKLTVNIKNGNTFADRGINGNPPDGIPDKYVKDENGVPTGVDADGDGKVDPYDIDGDGINDTFITDPDKGGPGWDTNGDGIVDVPVLPDPATGQYPDTPNVPGGLGNATNGIPDLTSPGVELGTSVNLQWQEGLILNPEI